MDLPTKIIIKVVENDDKLLAYVILEFGEYIIKGFRVQSGKYNKYWVTPPCYRSGKSFVPTFYTPNKELWAKIESMIIDEYEKVEGTYISPESVDSIFNKDS